MTERLTEGTIYETPFPRLLFRLWRKEQTGRLRLQKAGETRNLCFEKGRVVVEKEALGESDFLKALVKKRVLPADAARRSERHAATHRTSVVRALTELELISPLPLWNLIESFFVRRLFALFDWDDGRYAFEPGAALYLGGALGRLHPLDLVLQGVRQMRNMGFIDHHLPGPDEPIYVSTPFFLHQLRLEPHETYVLETLSAAATLESFYAMCELGTKDSRKAAFAFACLDILSAPAKAAAAQPGGAEPAPSVEQGKVLAALNDKCACVHKYITKQIGPLARTIIGNCLEEVKPGLGAMFQKMKLAADGRIEIDSTMVANVNHLPEDLFRTVVQGYDEILMAEILAVKKSLGAAHEAAVIKSLEKIGCL